MREPITVYLLSRLRLSILGKNSFNGHQFVILVPILFEKSTFSDTTAY